MELYLPIAQMSVHWLVILGMGGSVGFLSGLFGIGGGFLLAPLLMFAGIPPGVAVATTTSQVSAATFSGVVTHWKRKTLDLKMGTLMLCGGLTGTATGVYIFRLLREMGQMEFGVAVSYVVLLGSVGSLMLAESVKTIRDIKAGRTSGGRKPGQHNWIHGLPFKMRFRRSRLYISIFPPLMFAFMVGVLSAIMGVGGGFIMVPVMIYLIKMPASMVPGTTLFQVLFVTATATILHSVDNYSVDLVLAALLIVGGVIGAQIGVRLGGRLRGEQMRFLLALLTLAVAARLLYSLVVTPHDVYSLTIGAA
ncbi:MAG: sulfite exporter TauE/SafE family protein [Alphaproteobacteria bacterium]|nr:sulfite exporter TauE/SafE family protein [Alphaproteobacteria bacterium]MDE2011892.1 sulfite exporter TauE/SafE family protein [Alphaproteobacteria bacterium]MDE2073692.1 sulfite exporter TauE/SafE family protein [Alphaproteobacteria bacterium]